MKMSNHSWLTLAEMVRQRNLNDREARRMVKDLGELLAPRNFGDIVKYPAPVADLLARTISLRRQGWSIENLKNLIIMTRQEIQQERQDDRLSTLLADLRQESATLLANLKIVLGFMSQMQGELRSKEHV